MRWLICGAALTLLGFTSPLAAQDKSVPPLQRLIDVNFTFRLPAHDCTVPQVAAGLARRLHLPMGIEYLLEDCQRLRDHRSQVESINLLGLSVREALDTLSAEDRRYRWIEHDGVIVMRPVSAWGDPTNLLNYTTASFVLDDVNLGAALDRVVAAITGKAVGGIGEQLAIRTEQGARRFSVPAKSTSVGGALEDIARAHGDMWWEVRTSGGRRWIYVFTFDESGLGTPISK